MKAQIKYIELKSGEHTDRAGAWIARVWPSSSGKTLYFNGMALKQGNRSDANHYDLVSRESYWVTGVKKRGSNRHWSNNIPINIEQSLVEWYKEYTKGEGHPKLIVIPDLPKPDVAKFAAIENEKRDE